MPISDRSLLLVVLCAGCMAGPAFAFDPQEQPEGRAPVIESFKSVTDALKAGVRGLNAGDKQGAARALQYAATKGDIAAQYKLGRMYADGDGVEQDDYRAFRLYQQIANANAEEARGTMKAGVVAKAFVQLGSYYLDGIAGSPVRANPARAYEMFHYAASYFGDPDAQYNIGRMHLDGVHVDKDARQAARWLNLAAEKGHPYAQAVLGQILFNGQDGVPRQTLLGLSWMILARRACHPDKDGWVFDMTRKAETAASEDERRLAPSLALKLARGGPVPVREPEEKSASPTFPLLPMPIQGLMAPFGRSAARPADSGAARSSFAPAQ
jgi:TPR repeat protein